MAKTMTNLSVNVNKVAHLRNARNIGIPSVLWSAQTVIEAGAQGVTVHPRPDERHIRKTDVYEIADLLKNHSDIEFNIEGNPFLPPFMDIVRDIKPHQCTLVPDTSDSFTSDHGWDLTEENQKRLKPIIDELHKIQSRVSLFIDPDPEQIEKAGKIDSERIEFYTEPYASSYNTEKQEAVFQEYSRAAETAREVGLGINAGHDLNLDNLGKFCTIPDVLEVSIGHALISDALRIGLFNAVREYLKVLGRGAVP